MINSIAVFLYQIVDHIKIYSERSLHKWQLGPLHEISRLNKIKHLKRVVRAVDVTYAKILDDEGKQAGLWFSEYFWGIARFEAGNGLTVFSQRGNES